MPLAPVRDALDVPAGRADRDRAAGRGLAAIRPRRPGWPRSRPLSRLADVLARRQLLLVLDNCEHLVDAVARLAGRVLAAAPGVRILATSREPLGITGETLCPVPSLELPPEDAGAEEAARFAAVRAVRRPCGRGPAGVRRWTTRRPARWSGSAGRWTASRWPSSWPRRGCGR